MAGEKREAEEDVAEQRTTGETLKKLKTATGTDASALAKDATSNGVSDEKANAVIDTKPNVIVNTTPHSDGTVRPLDESMDLDEVMPHPVSEGPSSLSTIGNLLPKVAPRLSAYHGVQYTCAQTAIEAQSYKRSTTLFAYETTVNDPCAFGRACKAWSSREEPNSSGIVTQVVEMQNRAGAASIVSGFLSAGSPSSPLPNGLNVDKKVVTLLTNSAGILSMAPQLSSIFEQESKVVVQVSAQNTVMSPIKSLYDVPMENSEAGKISNDRSSIESDAVMMCTDYVSIAEATRQFDGATILYSATAEEAIAHSIRIYDAPGHFVHIFDGLVVGKTFARLNLDVASPSSSGLSFVGQADASTVFVGLASPAFELLMQSHSKAAFVKVSTLRPFSSENLANALPSTVKLLKVVEQTNDGNGSGVLLETVLAAILELGRPIRVVSANYSLTNDLSKVHPPAARNFLSIEEAPQREEEDVKAMLFYDMDRSATSLTAPVLGTMFAQDETLYPTLQSDHDNFTAGGIVRHTLRLSSEPLSASLGSHPESNANLVVVGDVVLFKELDVIKDLKEGGTLLVNTSWQPEELGLRLHPSIRQSLATKKVTIFLIDVQHALGVDVNNGKGAMNKAQELASVALHIAFLYLYTGQNELPDVARSALQKCYRGIDIDMDDLITHVPRALQRCAIPQDWSEALKIAQEQGETVIPLRSSMISNSTAPNPHSEFAEAEPSRSSWVQPAWHLMFPEAYGANLEAKRPDLPEKNYLVTVTENRRLTPLTYDRNIFHIEFDIRETGLTYEVGEALGIHGWNDEKEVQDFIDSYGLVSDEIVNFPSKEDPTRIESRTIFQVLQQVIDIFGRPGKSFYGLLADHAKSVDEERTLRFFASAEGSASFKKRGEVDTVTFADVFREFKSARPPFEALLTMVSPIKPRHYSIASSIKAHPDSVHLLVVTVDWLTPSGTPRYGQCTRYLVGLQPGAKVMVSIKPSVMKMPPNDMQPIIMAGLGTGLAPFMAYLQERSYRKNVLGKAVGPMALYLGSRYRAMEFLYGEQLLAYEADGLLTILGLAFSRDQKQKVYIQHLMDRDSKVLGPWLKEQNALTTLCGPTWPVPDFYQAMISALESTGLDKSASEKFVEEAKENERYVLEVY